MTRQLSPGDHFGRYRIDGVLGRGGMGEVYLAYDAQLRRKVALKILIRADEAGDVGASEKLLREARAAAAIEHPNAVQVYDVDEVDGAPFMAMELVEGKALRAYVKDATIPIETKLAWLVAIARALHAAHLKGVIHRDVKPENVMIREDGVVKVLDFGTARRVDVPAAKDGVSPMAMTSTDSPAVAAATTDRAIEGTLLYMAPEQVRGEVPDRAADQWSWGVLAYEMLTAAPPWDHSRGGVAILSQILSSDPERPRDRGVSVNGTIEDIVLRALSKPQENRFASMLDVAEALELELAFHEPEPIVPRIGASLASLVGAALLLSLFVGIVASGSKGYALGAVGRGALNGITAAGSPPDYGSPMSTNPTAFAEYEKAIYAARDAANSIVVEDALDRARNADPEFTAAYLRELLQMETIEAAWRDLFASAERRRDLLGAHDRALLDAIEPWFRVPQDPEQMRQRFAHLALEGNPDYDLQRCLFLVKIRDYADAIEACRSAQGRDPSVAAAFLGEGYALSGLGRDADAEQAYRSCLERSPGASRCLLGVSLRLLAKGRCAEYATVAHSLVDTSPEDPTSRVFEVIGIYARDVQSRVNLTGYNDAVASMVEHLPVEIRAHTRLAFEAAGDIADGRLDDAQRAYEELSRAFAQGADETFISDAYRLRLELLLELGRTEASTTLSREWLAEHAAWVPSPTEDSRIFPLAALYLTGQLPRARFEAERLNWLAEEEKHGAAKGAVGRWADAYGFSLRSADDAREALDAAERFGPMPPPGRDLDVDLALGRALVLTNDPASAVQRLRAVTEACPSASRPLVALEGHAWLATALSKLGEKGHACEALAVLFSRWPRGVGGEAIERARLERSALGCRD